MRVNVCLMVLLLMVSMARPAQAESGDFVLHEGYRFVAGVGAAIVKFDTKIKVLDKQKGTSVFLDPEGNLDLPEVSHVTTLYGGYSFNGMSAIGFSYFGVRRASRPVDFDKVFEDVRVVGDATITDSASFYSLEYGHTLFHDDRSKVRLLAGIYTIDLDYYFRAEGEITVDGVTRSDTLIKDARVVAPLPLVGLDFWFAFTPKWSMATKVAFVTGTYQDLSASVIQTGINARYKINDNLGIVLGLAGFSADVVIEDEAEKQTIGYAYNGMFAGAHFAF